MTVRYRPANKVRLEFRGKFIENGPELLSRTVMEREEQSTKQKTIIISFFNKIMYWINQWLFRAL